MIDTVDTMVREYAAHGWALVPIDKGSKGPKTTGWNKLENCITSADQCARIKGNVGLAHLYSGTCVMDFDDFAKSTAWLKGKGIDLSEIWAAGDAVRISSGRPNRGKLLFRLPDGVESLPTHILQDHGIELRCASGNGLTVQDVLPPSVHPDTGQPYTWDYPEPLLGHWSCPPVLPAPVLEVWQAIGKSAAVATPAGGKPPLDLTPAQIEEALGALDPDETYGEWLKVGMALHHQTEGQGFDVWDAWSSKGGKYQGEQDLQKHWDSFGQRMFGADITAGYLLKRASERGVHIAVDCADDFDSLVPTPSARPALPVFQRTDKGEILASKENVSMALRRADVCGWELRHDAFRDEVMLAPPGTDEWRPFRDTDYLQLCIGLERGATGFKDIPKERIRDTVAYVAEANTFDSARCWLEAQEWDGVPRVATFLPQFFGTADTPYMQAVGMYIWTALAGRIMTPGIKADMVPVAVGAQGSGKSSAVAAIVPSADFFLELDLGGKDDELARLMRGKLVIELGELNGLRAREAEHVKAFITRQYEEWVPKYREMQVRYARRCVFFGTTNKDEFLADDTGHRRWLPFRAGTCNPQGVIDNRGQLWAEGLQLFKASGVMWQGAEELAKAEHDAFVVRDAWEELVEAWLTTPDSMADGDKPIDSPFTAVGVLTGALSMKAAVINHSVKERMAKVLKDLGPKLGFAARKTRIDGKQVRGYVRII